MCITTCDKAIHICTDLDLETLKCSRDFLRLGRSHGIMCINGKRLLVKLLPHKWDIKKYKGHPRNLGLHRKFYSISNEVFRTKC